MSITSITKITDEELNEIGMTRLSYYYLASEDLAHAYLTDSKTEETANDIKELQQEILKLKGENETHND